LQSEIKQHSKESPIAASGWDQALSWLEYRPSADWLPDADRAEACEHAK
jgi:hypothetical protein